MSRSAFFNRLDLQILYLVNMIPIHIIEKHFPFFEKELQQQIAEVGDIKEFSGGDILMKTGQNIRSTMLVISGLVKIFREDEEGNEFELFVDED